MLFCLINEAMSQIIDRFFQLERKYAAKALEGFYIFLEQCERLESIFLHANLNHLSARPIPVFNIPKKEFAGQMEAYLHTLVATDSSIPPRPNKPSSTKVIEPPRAINNPSNRSFDWEDWLLGCGVHITDASRYALKFQLERIDPTILQEVDKGSFRDMGVTFGDIIRIQKGAKALASSFLPSQPPPVHHSHASNEANDIASSASAPANGSKNEEEDATRIEEGMKFPLARIDLKELIFQPSNFTEQIFDITKTVEKIGTVEGIGKREASETPSQDIGLPSPQSPDPTNKEQTNLKEKEQKTTVSTPRSRRQPPPKPKPRHLSQPITNHDHIIPKDHPNPNHADVESEIVAVAAGRDTNLQRKTKDDENDSTTRNHEMNETKIRYINKNGAWIKSLEAA